MTNNRIYIKRSIITFVLAIILFISVNAITFLLIPKVKDFELFSYGMYGALLFYGIGCLIFLLYKFLIGLKFNNTIIDLIAILLSIELASLLFTQEFITGSIITSIKEGENYIILAYFIIPIITYFISDKIIR